MTKEGYCWGPSKGNTLNAHTLSAKEKSKEIWLSTAPVKLLMKESDDGGTARLAGPGKV